MSEAIDVFVPCRLFPFLFNSRAWRTDAPSSLDRHARLLQSLASMTFRASKIFARPADRCLARIRLSVHSLPLSLPCSRTLEGRPDNGRCSGPPSYKTASQTSLFPVLRVSIAEE